MRTIHNPIHFGIYRRPPKHQVSGGGGAPCPHRQINVSDCSDRSATHHNFPPRLAEIVNWKIAPCGLSGDAQMRPPWASTIELQIANPIPIPSVFVVKNALKIWSIFFGSKPPPKSHTLNQHLVSFQDARFDSQYSRSGHKLHCLDTVHCQVQYDLLQMYSITKDQRKCRQHSLHRHVARRHLVLE